MRINKKVSFFVLTFCFLLLACGGKKIAVSTPPTPMTDQSAQEKTLEQKLGGQKEKSLKSKYEKRIDPSDPKISARDKEISLRTREKELRDELDRVEKAKKKLYTPTERVVESKMAKEEREIKSYEKRIQEIREFTKVRGCPAGSVKVSPKAVPPAWRMQWSVILQVDITNAGALDVEEIRAGARYGILVENLCSGGRLSIAFYLDSGDSDQKEVVLTATSNTRDGVVAQTERRFSLNRNNIQYNRIRTETWTISLQRQHQTR